MRLLVVGVTGMICGLVVIWVGAESLADGSRIGYLGKGGDVGCSAIRTTADRPPGIGRR